MQTESPEGKPDFPDWAPKKVIAEWEKAWNEAHSWLKDFPTVEVDLTEANMLLRLLTYEDMKSVWSKLPDYKIRPDLFSSMVSLAYLYPKGDPANKPPKQYAAWLKDVKETAEKLAKLVYLSDFDRVVEEEFLRRNQTYTLRSILEDSLKRFSPEYSDDGSEPSYKSWPDFCPGLLSKYLRQISQMNSEDDVGLCGIKEETVRLKKPNHKQAHREYFIKKLTQLIKEQTGKPLRDIVHKTAATVFDNPDLDERQIYRSAPPDS